MFTTSNIGPNKRLICSDTLRYWRFLQTGCQQNVNIFASLHNGINRLIKKVEAFEENDSSNLVKRKTFDLKVITDHLEKAMSSLPAEAPGEVDGEVCLKRFALIAWASIFSIAWLKRS